MSALITLSIPILVLAIIRDILFYLWLWQIKEYRIDRMLSYLKEENPIAKNNLAYAIALLFFVLIKNNPLFPYLAFALSLFLLYQIIIEVVKSSLKRPDFTARIFLTLLLLAGVYSLMAFCFFTSGISSEGKFELKSLLLLLFIIVVNPILISAIILSTNPIFSFQKSRIIMRAQLKMEKFKKVRTIGITGSYGKTSTKEFLFSILSLKYKVVKTEGNNNTNIGVAYTVLNRVSDEYDFFICEMGAYKIGEIAEISGIAKPEIGILTGINEQHADLFGSMENTIKAKFELINALPENGLAVVNERIKNNDLKFRVNSIKYFSIRNASDMKVYPDSIEFVYGAMDFKVNIIGKHYAENLISAIMVAEYLGMNTQEIKHAIEKIKPTEYMMKKADGLNGSIFIDNTYSANPDGVIAALEYLKEAFPDRNKIIVFPGIIELGKERDKIQKMLYDKIDNICDKAYILERQKAKGKRQNNKCEFIFEKDFGTVANMLKKDLNDKTVVLFESRGAGVVMKKMRQS